MRDRAPRIERFPQGDAWIMEGALDPISFGANCNAGIPYDQRSGWCTWESVRAGGYDPAARLGEQDQDRVDAEVLYPTPRISNSLFWNTEDPEFHVACIRAYNDWLSEYCAHAPDRLWGVAMMPNVGTDAAVEELHRARALPGMRGAMIGQYPHGGLDIGDEDDAFWAAAAGSGTPVSIHVGFATEAQGDKKRGKMRGDMRFFDAPIRAAQLIGGAVFDRHPSLDVLLVEVDCSWIPYIKEQMDDRFARENPKTRVDLKQLPSQYFETNMAYTFITDSYGIRNRHDVGVSQMMWSSDYPHGGSDWPASHATIERHFEGVPADEERAILAGNALRFYTVSDQ
jgi:predicted TIM-barrel fold metal-dependent hydrolase